MAPKAGFMTAKAVATRQKAKGLQKLRFYCQMCEKQCRDENGFKCHLSSEAHARQMALFGEDPARAVASFSDQFQASFLDLMRTRHPASRVDSQIVYNELVADRGHIHMNATVWHTLTDFVKHLGRAGLCRVDQDDKGHWWVALAAADAAAASAAAARAKKERAEAEEAAREAASLRAQVEAAAAAAAAARQGEGVEGGAPKPSSELVRGEGDAPIRLAVPARAVVLGPGTGSAAAAKPAAFDAAAAAAAAAAGGAGAAAGPLPPKPAARPSALASLMEREQAAKRARLAAAAPPPPPPPAPAATGSEEDAPWVRPGIVVKLVAPSLRGGPYWRAKGTVAAVSGGGYVAEVEVAGPSGDDLAVLRVDQAHCETVLPAPGGRVVVVLGAGAGRMGVLEEIDEARFRARVTVEGAGEAWYEYEDICKRAGR